MLRRRRRRRDRSSGANDGELEAVARLRRGVLNGAERMDSGDRAGEGAVLVCGRELETRDTSASASAWLVVVSVGSASVTCGSRVFRKCVEDGNSPCIVI